MRQLRNRNRQMCFDWFKTPLEIDEEWRDEIYRDYRAPFIVQDEYGQRQLKVGSYGFVPQRHRPFKRSSPEEQAKIDKAIASGNRLRSRNASQWTR